MNKETIYIEPSDDITDILSRIKASDKKIIALVPPKKPSVLLSSVNIKLIARAAKSAKKAIVLVTTNDSLTKLAMTANLPVAPSLKSRPIMPGEEAAAKSETEAENEEPEDEDDDDDKSDEEDQDKDGEEDNGKDEKDEESEEDEDDEDEEGAPDEDDKDKDGEIDDNEEDEDDEEKDEGYEEEEPEQPSKKPDKKPAKKANKSEKEHNNAFIALLINHKIWFIVGAATLVVLILFLVWAFTIAPRVKVSVSVRTASGNFSENVSFTKKPEDESSDTGSFYLHEEKIEKDQVVKFTATGKKDLGEPASGSLVIVYYFTSYNGASIEVSTSNVFTYNGMNYSPTSSVTLSGPSGKSASKLKTVCNNYTDDYDPDNDACEVSATVSIKATAPGEDYNISDETSFDSWNTNVAGLYARNTEAVSGGTSKIVTVVQQSDVDLALDKLKSESTSGDKEELYGKLSDTVMPVEATFKIVTSDPQTTPAVGEEVKEGVTPQVSTKTVSSVYTIDRVRVEEFITKKANLEEGKRLYSYGEPFIEYFAEASNDTYTGKLKTTYKVGPEISETEVLDKIRGEKIGRIEPILKDAFSGISSVKTEKSYFWVNSIPNDENKVEINLTIEE